MIRRRIVLAGSFVVLFALGWWVGRSRATGDLYASLDLFVEVLHKIEDNYVDPVDPARMIEGALKGMLKELDPYSQYLDQKAYGNLQDVTQGKFSGIGVVVSVRENYPTVVSPIEGSPAWEAGLHSGDAIVRIEGRSSAGFSVEEAANLLRGPEGTRVRVTVRREGDDQDHEYVLKRREIVTRSVPYSFVLEDGVGYARLANFSEKSGIELRAALERLRARGARSLVLDVRMNPGGLLDQAVDVAEQFLPKGELVVYTRGRARGQDNRFYASEARSETRWPMVVLVDHGSASASEIVAGALQDRDRALVIGRTTFGKGSVQSVFPLRGHDAALKLTTALYYTPSGRSIHRAVRDSSEDLDDDDDSAENAGPGVPADESVHAPDDSLSRPVYRTASGRRVYGGGGITPDLTVRPDSLPPLASSVEQRGLAFRFANRWANTHPGSASRGRANETPWNDFVAFLRAEKFPFDDAELRRERGSLDRAIRRELARRSAGDSAAVRVALEYDPVFERALQILRRARVPSDVFAAVDLTAPDRPAGEGRGLEDARRPGSGSRAGTRGERAPAPPAPGGKRSRGSS